MGKIFAEMKNCLHASWSEIWKISNGMAMRPAKKSVELSRPNRVFEGLCRHLFLRRTNMKSPFPATEATAVTDRMATKIWMPGRLQFVQMKTIGIICSFKLQVFLHSRFNRSCSEEICFQSYIASIWYYHSILIQYWGPLSFQCHRNLCVA